MTTVELVKSFVSSLQKTVLILSQSTENKIITTIVNNNYWLTIGDIVTIDGKEFEVVGIESCNVIQFLPVIDRDTIKVDGFVIDAPTFYHGTLKMTKNEVNKAMNKEEITPLVYLREPIVESKVYDDESAIDRDSEWRLYFLGSANTKDWLTEDHYELLINRIQSLVDQFIKQVDKSRFIAYEYTSTSRALVNVSITGDQNGSLFDMNLSGIELILNVEIRKDLSCSSNCL